MRRLLALVVLLAAASTLPAFEAGGGVAVFLPESLYAHGDGSVSVQTALGTGMRVSDFATIPIRVAYNQVYGLMPSGTTYESATRPWFYADSILADIQLKIRVPLGTFYIDAFGGGAANWLAGLKPLTKNIETSIAAVESGVDQMSFAASPVYSTGLGFGWLAGGGFGIRIDTISVDLSATYLTVDHPLSLSGAYYAVPGGSATVDYTAPDDLGLRMRGLIIGIRGAIAL